MRDLGPPCIHLSAAEIALGPNGLGWSMGPGYNMMGHGPHHEYYNNFVGTMSMTPW